MGICNSLNVHITKEVRSANPVKNNVEQVYGRTTGMEENRIIANNGSSIVLYTADDGNTQLEVKLEKDTVWLTQSQMAALFGRDRTVISRHIKNIFKEGELDESLVCAKNAQAKKYGRREDHVQISEITFYNLDVIISVGYRVKSINGTKFRIWATALIKQYLIKGYAIDRRRLDHYDELKDGCALDVTCPHPSRQSIGRRICRVVQCHR